MSVQTIKKGPATQNSVGPSDPDSPNSAPLEMSRSRSIVLSYLLKLNKSIDAQHADLVQAIAQRFNEVLVDYISYGHFRLLEAYAPAAHQMAAIDRTTQQALLFSDRYTTHDEIDLAAMKRDLEDLAYALEVRFEIEDEVVANVAA